MTNQAPDLPLDSPELPPAARGKFRALAEDLARLRSAVVAYSGGVDSSLLAYITSRILGERMMAITMQSPLETGEMMRTAAELAERHGIPHLALSLDLAGEPALQANPPDRCYTCKRIILHRLWAYARRHQYQAVLEGQNADDLLAHRPGRKAVQETGTLSPLAKHGLTKAEVRQLARVCGLSVWDRPSTPCLATRIPYGTPVTRQALEQVAEAEAFLRALGFSIVRVRHYEDTARIEVETDKMNLLLKRRKEIVEALRSLGYRQVTLDLQGYRSGSMDEGLEK